MQRVLYSVVIIGVFLATFFLSASLWLRENQPLSSSSVVFNPTPVPTILPDFFATAPSQTMVASIMEHFGTVSYISRTATSSSPLDIQAAEQGEELLTGSDGGILIQFSTSQSAQLAADSQIGIIQTLPEKIVLEHKDGVVVYSAPLSVRAKRLLIQLDAGEIRVSYDSDLDKVVADQLSGSSTLAFNNAAFMSQVYTLSNGKRAVFDNAKRKLTIR